MAAAACNGDPKGNPTNVTNPPLAYVRYFNALGDTLGTDFRPIDQITYSTPFLATPFRGLGLGGYQGYSTGARHIRVFPNSFDINVTSKPFLDTTFTFDAGLYYTVVHAGYTTTGVQPRQGLWIMVDTFPAATTMSYRVMNVGPDLGAVDVYVTASATDALPATPTFSSRAFRSATPYTTRAVGAFAIRVFAAGNTTTPLVTATAPAGVAGTTLADPVGGSGQAGTVMTAMIYSKSTAGSGAQSFTTPGLVFWVDRQPPRTTP
jgi:hypothetical protein